MAESKKAEAIREALEATRDKWGRITPKGVVEAARSKRSVLYPEFGKLWDANFAQQKALEDRARSLITTYLTIPVIRYSKQIKSVLYVKDERLEPREQGYVALTNDELERKDAQAIVLRELSRCENAITRARGIASVLDAAFPGMSQQLENMLQAIIDMRIKLDEAA
jgi:hypothetical protein